MSSPVDDETLIARMTAYMHTHMHAHDPSHNPSHVHRVVALSQHILSREQHRSPDPSTPYNPTVTTLSALLHDINDRKYRPAPPSASEMRTEEAGEVDSSVRTALLAHGADPDVARRVDFITSYVSYTAEKREPAVVARSIRHDGFPELAIVQDADRLDALGAIGVGRCFTYLGASAVGKGKETEERPELDDAIGHFGDKLERLEGMMKTETGREMARVRTERLRVFRSWWEEEMEESRPIRN